MKKCCKKCKEQKPLADFYPDRKMADGLRSDCKECVKKKVMDAKKAKKEWDIF
jgi:hypothetical protein